MIVAGVGCSLGCGGEEILALVDDAVIAAGRRREEVAVLATIDRRSDEPGILAAADARRWRLAIHPASALASVDVPNPSPTVTRHVGTPSVAEAAALLESGAGSLLVAKRRSPQATCALAEVAG